MSRTGWPGVFVSGRTKKKPGGTRKQVRLLKAEHKPKKRPKRPINRKRSE